MKKFFRGFKYAFNGLYITVKGEINFRIHTVMAAYVLFFAIVGAVTPAEFAVLSSFIALVLSLELINTALESLCDRVTKEIDFAIGKTKDLAAGAVLVCAIFAAASGLYIFLQENVVDTILTRFAAHPIVPILFLISIPIAFIYVFVFKTKK